MRTGSTCVKVTCLRLAAASELDGDDFVSCLDVVLGIGTRCVSRLNIEVVTTVGDLT